MPNIPERPHSVEPVDWEHWLLWKRVKTALFACFDRFSTTTSIEGLMATDIFTLNNKLAATIEEVVVKTLNSLRFISDPNSEYDAYSFVRQSYTFPYVVLETRRRRS